MKKILLNFGKNTFIFIVLFIELITFTTPINGQTISVQGNLNLKAVSRWKVKNASVTFINNADTTNKFTTLTDNSGNYQINLTITSIKNGNILPKKFKLEQNYPNPFASSTSIPYSLSKETNVHVTIYDILGRVVRKFSVSMQSAGAHNILWNGRNNIGEKVASGVYFYRLSADGESLVKKMIFNQNVKAPLLLPSLNTITGKTTLAKTNKTQNNLGNTFTIRIQDTNTTSPLIVSQEVNNVVINSDTTINFSLNYIPLTTVNLDSLHQIIRGFGAANIVQWRPDMTSAEIQTAFGNGPGQLGFTILRLRIPPDSTSFALNVPTAKAASSMGAKIIASPWTPPAWMKTNNSTIAGTLKVDAYAAYAAHLKAFADTMANNGVPLYAISLQNEPDANVNYESCYWTPTEFLNFCKNNAASIGTKIMMPESERFNTALSDPTLNDSAAAANVAIIAGHIYGGPPSIYPLAEEKGKDVWMTEHLLGSTSDGNLWPSSLDVGTEIQNVMLADMNAYVYWYIIRFYGPIGDGTSNTIAGRVTKRGYVMSQFAKFIRPGYYRVESSVNPSISHVEVTAYKDSSSSKIVIVAINTDPTQTQSVFRIQNLTTAASFTTYTTSATENVAQGNTITVTNGGFTYTLEPSSITTFVSN